MRVAIGGSRALPRGQAPRLVALFLAALPDDTTILLRRPIVGRPGEFERSTANLARWMHLDVDWCHAELTETSSGRSAVYARDYAMVERSDLVLLFIAADDAEPGTSGTSHLVDAALQANRPVYTYAVTSDGKVTRVGEYDPEHLYGDIAPRA